MSKLTKHQIKDDRVHDILVEGYGNLLGTLESHWQLYLWFFLGVVVVGIGGFFGWTWWSSRTAKAYLALDKVQEAYSATISPSGSVSPADSATPSFPSAEARDKEVQKLLGDLKKTGSPGEVGDISKFYDVMQLAGSGKVSEAETALGPLVGNAKFKHVALRLRARLYESQSQWDMAEADWKALAALKSQLVPEEEGLWLLGQYYERRQDSAKAIESYDKALTLMSKAPEDSTLKSKFKKQIESLKGAA